MEIYKMYFELVIAKNSLSKYLINSLSIVLCPSYAKDMSQYFIVLLIICHDIDDHSNSKS